MDANNVDNSSNHEVMSPGINLNNCPGYVDPSAMLNYPVSSCCGTCLSSRCSDANQTILEPATDQS